MLTIRGGGFRRLFWLSRRSSETFCSFVNVIRIFIFCRWWDDWNLWKYFLTLFNALQRSELRFFFHISRDFREIGAKEKEKEGRWKDHFVFGFRFQCYRSKKKNVKEPNTLVKLAVKYHARNLLGNDLEEICISVLRLEFSSEIQIQILVRNINLASNLVSRFRYGSVIQICSRNSDSSFGIRIFPNLDSVRKFEFGSNFLIWNWDLLSKCGFGSGILVWFYDSDSCPRDSDLVSEFGSEIQICFRDFSKKFLFGFGIQIVFEGLDLVS